MIAAATAGTAAAPSTGGSGLLLFLMASLVVIAMAYGAVRLLGNWQISYSKGRRLRVLEGVPLGKDRSLLLVAVGKELLVVGASPQGVQLVHQVTDPDAVAALLAQPEPGAQPAADLAAEPAIQQHLERMRSLLSRSEKHHEQ